MFGIRNAKNLGRTKNPYKSEGGANREPMTNDLTHDEKVARFTGGLAPNQDLVPQFTGSPRLRADGRPRPQFRAELRRIPNLVNAGHVVTTLALPVLIVAVVVTSAHWGLLARIVIGIAAFLAMGSWFQRVLTLHHEAAHRLLFSNRALNDLIGEKLIGWLAFGDGGSSYRRAHSQHHRDEFGEREPDFLLYAQYPISKASMRRKLLRDGLGISGYKNLRPALVGLRVRGRRLRALRFLSGQVFVFALFGLAGHPWLYFWLWLLPWATYFRVFNRLRALAEHGGMTRSEDRRLTTHNIRQGVLSRYVFLSQGIGFHLAHHVDSGIPMGRLHILHRALVEDGYIDERMTYPGYWAFFRTLVR